MRGGGAVPLRIGGVALECIEQGGVPHKEMIASSGGRALDGRAASRRPASANRTPLPLDQSDELLLKVRLCETACLDSTARI
jgi:hypothetical protein